MAIPSRRLSANSTASEDDLHALSSIVQIPLMPVLSNGSGAETHRPSAHQSSSPLATTRSALPC